MESPDPPDDRPSSSRMRNRLRWAAIGLAGLMLAYAAVHGALHILLDPDALEHRINTRLAAATDSAYRVKIGDVKWSLLRRSLEAERVSLQPDSSRRSAHSAPEDSTRSRYFATVPRLSLQGIHLWPLIWHRALVLNRAVLQAPHVRLHREATGSTDTDTSDSRPRPSDATHAALAQPLPSIEVRTVRVDGATVWLTSHDRPAPSDSLWGLSVRMRDFTVGSTAARDSNRILFSRTIRAEAAGYRHRSADSLYALRTGAVRAASHDSSLAIDTLRLAPTVTDAAFLRRIGHRANRYETAIRFLQLTGLHVRDFVEEGALRAHTAHVDSLVVDVYRNNHWPNPAYDPPPPMPHDAFQSVSRHVRLDTIRVTNSRVTYSKLAEDATQPGRIAFENLSAVITNVTNDPDRMTPATPAVVNATTRVAGAGRLQTTIWLPLLAPNLTLAYRGHLGPMDARALNTAFVNLAGVRIEEGTVDSLWFAAQVESGTATGTMEGVYRNLDLELLDKNTGSRGLKDRIRTRILNDLMIKSSNTSEDEALRTGEIDFTYNEGDSFFKFLWHSVRDGIYSLVGM